MLLEKHGTSINAFILYNENELKKNGTKTVQNFSIIFKV